MSTFSRLMMVRPWEPLRATWSQGKRRLWMRSETTRLPSICLMLLFGVILVGCEKKESTDGKQATAPTSSDASDASTNAELADSPHYPLPKENTVEALLDYISALGAQHVPQDDRYIERQTQIMEARVLGAQRLLRLENKSLPSPDGDQQDEQSHIIAAEVELEALRMLAFMDAPKGSERRDAFLKWLLEHKDPEIARIGRLGQVQIQADELLRGRADNKSDQFEALVAQVRELLKNEERDERLFMVTSGIAQTLADGARSAEQSAAGVQLLKDIGTAFADHEDMTLATRATSQLDYADIVTLERSLRAGLESQTGQLDEFERQFRELLQRPTLSSNTVQDLLLLLQEVEYRGRAETASRLYEAMEEASDKIPDALVREEVLQTIGNARKRTGLIGQPIELEGVAVDGTPFDWQDYRGKVVLVDFWATWCGPCIREIPNIRSAYDEFHADGFDVVGVNIDSDVEAARQFVQKNQLPWTTIVTADPAQDNAMNPNAVRYGVVAIPFLVLVGRDGNVATLHSRGPELAEQVRRLLDAPGETSEPGPASEETPAEERPDAAEADAASETTTAPSDEPAADENAEDQTTADREPTVNDETTSDGESANEEEPADGESGEPVAAAGELDLPAIAAEANPYDPPSGLDAAGLVDFLLDMEDKPKSIQYREGFTDGVVKAADLVLANKDTKGKHREIAATTKLKYLHRDACLGDEAADRQLADAVDQLRAETLPAIVNDVAFFTAEREALASVPGPGEENVSDEEIAKRIEKLQQYFTEQQAQLSARHLRMASAMVELINRIPDDAAREKLFQEFGALLSSGEDKSLARYGRRIANSAPGESSDLVGKPLELAGATADGQSLDWESYRGHVVLVDFWATWCGPCRAALPELLQTHETHQEKGLRIVGVNLDQEEEALAQFLQEMPLPWAHLVGDPASEAADRYGVRGIPTLMLVDRQGTVVAVGHHLADVREAMMKLLDAPVGELPNEGT